MALIYLYKNRGITKDLQLLDGAGEIVAVSDSDSLRIIIGREGQLGAAFVDAQLVVVSGTPTDNGSTLTLNTPETNKHRLRIDDADANLIPAGTYTLFFDMMDHADADDWKNISRQVLVVEET